MQTVFPCKTPRMVSLHGIAKMHMMSLAVFAGCAACTHVKSGPRNGATCGETNDYAVNGSTALGEA
jgi:hypothetical protein